MLRPRRPPRVVQLETLIAEISPAVGAALRCLERLGRLAELAHHGHTAQANGVSIPWGKLVALAVFPLPFQLNKSDIF